MHVRGDRSKHLQHAMALGANGLIGRRIASHAFIKALESMREETRRFINRQKQSWVQRTSAWPQLIRASKEKQDES
jgi:hypothetical protein